MDAKNPRFSTSEHLLGVALEHAASALGAETKLIKLNDLNFRNCEGYYSKAAKACTWPCSVTSMDKTDQLDQVYEMAVHWADILLIATPIRWGAASSLYYKMVERMNCIQNQITLNNKVLIRNKVAAFIITGGQDGIQAVAGQMMGFFSEIGYLLPQFPFIAHSLGWEFEEMERNMDFVQSERGPARRRARAGGARVGDVEVPARARDRSRQHRARRQKGVAELIDAARVQFVVVIVAALNCCFWRSCWRVERSNSSCISSKTRNCAGVSTSAARARSRRLFSCADANCASGELPLGVMRIMPVPLPMPETPPPRLRSVDRNLLAFIRERDDERLRLVFRQVVGIGKPRAQLRHGLCVRPWCSGIARTPADARRRAGW